MYQVYATPLKIYISTYWHTPYSYRHTPKLSYHHTVSYSQTSISTQRHTFQLRYIHFQLRYTFYTGTHISVQKRTFPLEATHFHIELHVYTQIHLQLALHANALHTIEDDKLAESEERLNVFGPVHCNPSWNNTITSLNSGLKPQVLKVGLIAPLWTLRGSR